MILSLSHGFEMSFIKKYCFSGVFGSFSERLLIFKQICVIHRKYWYIYQIKPKNGKQETKNVPLAGTFYSGQWDFF